MASVGTVRAARSPLLASGAEHVGNLVVAALACDDVRAGRVPIGPDAAVRVGSEFEQQPGHLEIALQDGHVHRAHFAAAQVHDLRAPREQLARGLEIAALGGLVQSGRGDAVDGGLQFRPAFEPIGPRQHELGVMQRKGLGRGGAVIGRRPRRRLPETTHDRLRAIPWPGVSVDRGRGSRAWRESAVSDSYELLSWPRLLRACRGCPPSAVPGQKRVHVTNCCDQRFRGGRRPSRGRGWRPDAPIASIPNPGTTLVTAGLDGPVTQLRGNEPDRYQGLMDNLRGARACFAAVPSTKPRRSE